MKKLFVFSVLYFITFLISAQKTIPVLLNEKTFGENYLTKTDIRGLERTFPKSIQQVYIDTTTNRATIYLYKSNDTTLYLRRPGKIVLYDLQNNSVKWIKKISSTMGNFLQYNDVLIYFNRDGTYRINMETAKKLWKSEIQLYYLNSFTQTGMGYSIYDSDNQKRLEAVDLQNGRNKWYRNPVSAEYGWSDLFSISDSSIMLVSSGLHTIDLKTGWGWDYDAITGSNDYTSTILANSAGILLGAFTGYYPIYYGHDVITDIASNVCFDDHNRIFFASKEKMACLYESDGKEIWNYEFEKRTTSKSSIFLRDSLVYMINFGYAYMNNFRKDIGRPFICAFNRVNGSQVFMSKVSTKDDRILDFLISESDIVMLFKDRIANYSINDGHLIQETNINTSASGNLLTFCGDRYYMSFDSVYQSLLEKGPYNLYVLTEKKQVLTLDNKFNILNTTPEKQYYTSYLEANGLRFLGKPYNTVVIDIESKKVAEINVSKNAFLMGNDLFDIQGRTLFQVDLKGLLK